MTAAPNPRDPYHTLGIPRDATRPIIRDAYRRRAKKTHPDAGGSPAEFARIQQAYLLLTDDTRRAKYDATGEIDESTVDNSRANQLQFLASLLDAALNACEKAGKDAFTIDLIEAMRELATKNLAEIKKKNADLAAMKKRIEKLSKRFKVKKKRDAPNLLESILRARLAPIDVQIAANERQAKDLETALTLLDDFTFTADEVQMVVQRVAFFSPMSGSTTA